MTFTLPIRLLPSTETSRAQRSSRCIDDDGLIDGGSSSLLSRASNWDIDNNFGCGDTASVSGILECIHNSDVIYPPSQATASIERCMSCFSKLGAAAMSRSSTGIGAQFGFGQQPLWSSGNNVQDSNNESSILPSCGHKSNHSNKTIVCSDQMSLCSSQGSSNNSEYSTAKLSSVGIGLDLWNVAENSNTKTCTCPRGGVLTLRRNGLLVCTICDGGAPIKPGKGSRSSRASSQNPPMPLPITTQLQAYENYDFPKGQLQAMDGGMENYDTPRKIHEYILAGPTAKSTTAGTDYSNYDMPAVVGMCSCFHSTAPFHEQRHNESVSAVAMLNNETFGGDRPDCACNRVMSWADSWICKRGNGVENTEVIVNKIRLNGEGRMPIVQMRPQQSAGTLGNYGEMEKTATSYIPPPELYATVDVTKKLKSRLIDTRTLQRCECPKGETEETNNRPDIQLCNYINIYPSSTTTTTEHRNSNYANLTFNSEIFVPNRTSKLIDGEFAFVEESDVSMCQKCGFARLCTPHGAQATDKNPNYLFMEPKKILEEVPGYLPMSPVTLSDPNVDSVNANFDGRVSTAHSTLKMRNRSASADSSRFPEHEDKEEFKSSETLRKASCSNIHEHRRRNTETEDDLSISFATHSNPTNSVNIRRSESVPCKAQNRDSSSSNDSGVSTGSLKLNSKDGAFVKKHRNSLPYTHVTLPRRSKSSDPLKELSFHFGKDRNTEKSTSAEAEIPMCKPKGADQFENSKSQIRTGPNIDSRSTSSGTSDMSDYIETLSISSHSSIDVADAATR